MSRRFSKPSSSTNQRMLIDALVHEDTPDGPPNLDQFRVTDHNEKQIIADLIYSVTTVRGTSSPSTNPVTSASDNTPPISSGKKSKSGDTGKTENHSGEPSRIFDYTRGSSHLQEITTKNLDLLTDVQAVVTEGLQKSVSQSPGPMAQVFQKKECNSNLSNPNSSLYCVESTTNLSKDNCQERDPADTSQPQRSDLTTSHGQPPIATKPPSQARDSYSRIPLLIQRPRLKYRSMSVDQIPIQASKAEEKHRDTITRLAIDPSRVKSLRELTNISKRYKDKKHISSLQKDLNHLDRCIRDDLRSVLAESAHDSLTSDIRQIINVEVAKLEIKSRALSQVSDKKLDCVIELVAKLHSKIEDSIQSNLAISKELAILKEDLMAKVDLAESTMRSTEARLLDMVECGNRTGTVGPSIQQYQTRKRTRDIQDRVKAMACRKGITMSRLRADNKVLSDAIDLGDEQKISDALIEIGESEDDRYIDP